MAKGPGDAGLSRIREEKPMICENVDMLKKA